MRKLVSLILALFAIYALTMPVAGQNWRDAIGQARSSYYNPKRQGFGGFTASIKPNWKVTLGPTATQQNLKVFQSIRFLLALDANGAVTVTRDFAEQAAGQEAYVKQIQENLQRLVSGFFGVWTVFTLTSPLPESGSALKIDNRTGELQLAYTTDTTNVGLKLTSDFAITELTLNSPGARRIIKPVFEKTPEGFLLKGYHSLYEPVGQGVKTDLEVTIEYQFVDVIRLPHKLELRGILGNEPIAAELIFDQYELNPRNNASVLE